jgi:hypothetical protein
MLVRNRLICAGSTSDGSTVAMSNSLPAKRVRAEALSQGKLRSGCETKGNEYPSQTQNRSSWTPQSRCSLIWSFVRTDPSAVTMTSCF